MLAAKALNSEEAKSFMSHHSLIAADVLEHKVTWDDIGKRLWEQHN